MKAWLLFPDNIYIRYVAWIILIVVYQPISGLTTAATSEILPWSVNNITCIDNANHKIDYIHGDIVISIISINPLPSQFILRRVSDSIDSRLSLGIRTIIVTQTNDVKNLLIDEVQYLEQCVQNPVGILVSSNLWPIVVDIVADIEYNIWQIPSTSQISFPSIAHLLYEYPWTKMEVPSIELKAENAEIANEFLSFAMKEHLCLTMMPGEENVYLILGNNMLLDDSFDENGTIFAIPMFAADSFIRDLPHGAYIFLESDVQFKLEDRRMKFGLSSVFIISSILNDLVKFVNRTSVLCNATNANDMVACNELKTWSPNAINLNTSMEFLKDVSLQEFADDLNIDLIQKVSLSTNESMNNTELRQVASINVVTNVTTFYHYKDDHDNSISNKTKLGRYFPCNIVSPRPTIINQMDDVTRKPIFIRSNYSEMYWRIKPEAWVAVGLTISVLGVLISLVILLFIVFRIYMNDVLEGNPIGTIILLISLVVLFVSFVPFSIEYTSDKRILEHNVISLEHSNTICSIRVFLLTLCYSLIFSLLLCRSVMLASIGSEGGFLSHVNGYVQSVLCMFSVLVQIGLSTQLVVLMHVAKESISCDNIYYGHWLWALLAYDSCLLAFLVMLLPLIFRSQRNYKEGVLLTIGTILCVVVWSTWIPCSTLGDYWRDAAVPLGLQGTGWAILGGILIPRCFLIVRGIARTDLAQALPSLTSLAFAQNTQYISEQSIYECVNPAMRQRGISNDNYSDRQSPSEIPTLPLRGASRKNQNPMSYSSSEHSTIPASPSKATRF
ncbi:Protein bride of sevenless [Pseudolycoriella hygida]|uniref:Protein bride of sevenless n=1 Tax=Pseudolycoriella hygida TaxID=35572 RepID=A0A9Q0ND41_9DIPT|nr:Protein bride of sevenless [Pseudolycoriella hygida]